MQALCLTDTFSYHTECLKPVIGSNEALIRLSVAGICATDLELVKGYAGFSGVLGHEFVGVVKAVTNEKDQHWLNQRVVGSINIGCNQCACCIDEGPEHCFDRKVLGIRGKDGVFADYFTLPINNLIAVADNITDESAVFTEPLAAAIRVREQLESIEPSNIAVVGPGRLGLLIGKVLSLAGYDVTMLGRSDKSLKLPEQWSLNTGKIMDVADNSYGCVVDATGCWSGFKQALRIIKPRGHLLLKSTFTSKTPIDLTKVVVSEICIMGSRCGPFAKALDLMSQINIPFETMIDGQYPLNEGLIAFDNAGQAGVRKILLRP